MKTCVSLGLAVIALTAASDVPDGRAADSTPTGADLVGRVALRDGSPVPEATVFIYTAGPKTGSAVLCPSCYPDCVKRTRTAADGQFRISDVDSELLFRLLVVGRDCESRFLEKVDPLAGPVAITLDLLRPDAFPEHQRILGMIIDEAGEPVVGAVVGPEGIARGKSTLWGGTTEFTDPLAVSDETGRFVLRCKEGIDFVHARVEGRNVARRWVRLQPGRDHVVRMDEGVLVTGRVEKDGVPQSGIMVGLVTQQRMAGQFIRIEEIATNDDGAFAIPNVPPDQDTVLYGRMDSSRGRGVVESRKFRSMQSGETLRLGALNVRPGHRLAGRVVLSDGRRVPAETRLLLGRDDAWDTAQVILDEDGRFEFLDVPAESVGLNLRVRGYKMSKKNPSLDWLNGGLVGRVEKDIDDFVILLEPGEWRRYNRDEGQPPDGDLQPDDKPLRSL